MKQAIETVRRDRVITLARSLFIERWAKSDNEVRDVILAAQCFDAAEVFEKLGFEYEAKGELG